MTTKEELRKKDKSDCNYYGEKKQKEKTNNGDKKKHRVLPH